MKFIIEKNTLGLVIKNNNKIKCYGPGVHNTFRTINFILNDSLSLEQQKFDINKYFFDDDFNNYIEKVIIEEGCFMIRYVNNIRCGIYKSGTHHFIKSDNNVKCDFYTKDDIELKGLTLDTIKALSKEGIVISYTFSENMKGVLYVDGNLTKVLNPGLYVFNVLNHNINCKTFNMAVQTIIPQNQELLTKDKVTLRINFWVNYKITNLDTILTNFDYSFEDILRNLIQMSIRSFISNKTLDEVLNEKDQIGNFILEYLKQKEDEYGISFLDAGIKDIILPGEIRDIMNTVLIAEKKAQANVITRREETASTRSLLNTAKLMEENEILYRLKELEMLERIFEKVGSVNVNGTNVLESLELLIGKKKK